MKYIIIILLFCGCYSEKKARQQFDKAATSFPIIPAEYCGEKFPVKDSTTADTLITTDTLYLEPLADTVMLQDFDTVRITITKTLPSKIITNTVHIRDTIIRTNTASVKSCEIDKSKLTALLVTSTTERDRYHSQAKKRGWIMWGLITFIILITGLNIYIKAKKNVITGKI